MSESLNVGIVGYGFATKTFHAPLVAGVPGLKLTAISSSDPAKVKADWPEVATETTPEALFARPDIDLVVIPTPNTTHFPLASAALAAGKHVVVDKPFPSPWTRRGGCRRRRRPLGACCRCFTTGAGIRTSSH